MPVVKVIELVGSSGKSFEDAVAESVRTASRTLKDIKSVDVVSFSVKVKNNKIAEYRANVKLAFLYKEKA